MRGVIPEGGYVSEIFASYQGEGAHVGERHLFVRFAGCNLRCSYCDTPASLSHVDACEVTYPGGSSESLPNPLTVARLGDVVARCLDEDHRISRISITGGEPMLQQRFIVEWLTRRPPPLARLLETAATISSGLDRILKCVGTVSADVKLPSNSGQRPQWEQHRRFLERCRDVDVYVKMPVSDDTCENEVRMAARLTRETVPGAPLYLQPITDPCSGTWQLGHSRLLALLVAASSEASNVRVLPQMHKLVGIR